MDTQRRTKYPQIIGHLLDALGLPRSMEGCRKAHRKLKVKKAMGMKRGGEDFFSDCLDNERIDALVRPHLARHPKAMRLVEEFEEMDEGSCSYLCSWLHSFIEDAELLAGNRPLPSHLGVHVKNLFNDEPSFGFLIWQEGRYLIRLERPETPPSQPSRREASYATAFDAAIDGWAVD